MNSDRRDGIGHKIKGTVKETVGKLIGDKKMEVEGMAEKAAGTVQNTVGGVKDVVTDATDCGEKHGPA